MKFNKCWASRLKSVLLITLYIVYVTALLIPGIDIYVLKIFNAILALLLVFMLVRYYEAKCTHSHVEDKLEEEITKAPIG